jgi:adenylate cyclase
MFAIDPLREEIHWRLLEACAAAGRRADAMRHHAAIVEALKRELGVAPGAQTRAIYQRLRAEMDPPAVAEVPVPAAGPAGGQVSPVPLGAPPAVAVLPFAQLGEEAVPSHLADGILIDTVCQLAGLRELQVISHGSTLSYRDPQADLRQVGRELGARYVVRGAMQRRGDALRLTTELADARTGAVVWARSHDTSAALGFADQDRLVAQIVNTLAPRVRDLELRRIRGQRPEALTVYEKILLAREHLQSLERDSFAEAKRLLDEAVREEPEYAEAYALQADWQGVSMNQGWLPYDNGGRQEPERLARLALALDRDNIRALVLYGHRRALLHRDYQGARDLFERALDVAPGAAHSWLWSSYTFAYDNEPQEAIRRVQRALDLSPRDRRAHDFYSAMCVAQYAARNYDEAAAWGRRALAESGVFVATMRWTAAALAASGRAAEAREVARMALEVAPAQRVANSVRNSPFGSEARREEYGGHLIAAGFNP